MIFQANKLVFRFLTNSTSNMINVIRSLILFIIFNLSLQKLLNTMNNLKKFLLYLISTISQTIYYNVHVTDDTNTSIQHFKYHFSTESRNENNSKYPNVRLNQVKFDEIRKISLYRRLIYHRNPYNPCLILSLAFYDTRESRNRVHEEPYSRENKNDPHSRDQFTCFLEHSKRTT